MTHELLIIRNNGKDILETNYFDSKQARQGIIQASYNNHCFRLMLPDRAINMAANVFSPALFLQEILNVEHAVITRGASNQFNKTDMLEILYEDYTTTPFAMFLGAEQCAMLPSSKLNGYEMELSIWTKAGKQRSMPLYYRQGKIPCLKKFPKGKRKYFNQ